MTTATLDLLKDIIFLLFFYAGTALTWGWIRLKPNAQKELDRMLSRSRKRFKWMFLIGAILLTGLDLWQYVINR